MTGWHDPLRLVTTPVGRGARRAYHVARQMAYERRTRPPRVKVSSPGTGTIYYLAPDFNEPAGGVRVIYRHVDLLNQAGVAAAVLHDRPGFRCTWFEHETRIADTRSTAIGPSDLLVVPEIFSAVLPSLPAGIRHVIFNQNGHLTWDRSPEAATRHYRRSADLLGVMTVSVHNTDLLRYAFPDLTIRRVRVAIDDELFLPASLQRARRICYMPRRGHAEVMLVLRTLRSRGVLDGWETQPLAGLRPRELSERLQESMIFLSSTYQEGFGLPPAEAMACGNYVVGFDGFGGREFFRPEFSRPVPTGDVLAMARAVEDTLEKERRQPGWCASRGAQASRFVLAEYSRARERDDVLAFYGEFFPG